MSNQSHESTAPWFAATRAAQAWLREACVTLNETWGYKEHDQDWKSPAQVFGGPLGEDGKADTACTGTYIKELVTPGPPAAPEWRFAEDISDDEKSVPI